MSSSSGLILVSKVDRARQSLLIEYVETYVPLAEPELNEFHALIRTEEPYKEVEKMVTVYEQVGREEGRLTGKQEMILGLLTRRFGKLPARLVKAIQGTQSAADLDELLYQSAEISTLSDLSLGKPSSRRKAT